MKIHRFRLEEGERYPMGYGFAWMEWHTGKAVIYPIPFNWVFRAFRELYFKLMEGPRNLELRKASRYWYNRGCKVGEMRGTRKGREQAYDELLRGLK